MLKTKNSPSSSQKQWFKKRRFTTVLVLAACMAGHAFTTSVVAQQMTLSTNEQKVLGNLNTKRTLATLRELSQVVVTQSSGLGEGTVVSGSEEEKIFADYIAEQMRSIGLDVQQEPFPVRSFTYGLVNLHMGGTKIDAVTLHSGGGTWGEIDGVRYAVGNSSDGRTIKAPLVDLGGGTAKDYERVGNIEGKVVLVQRGLVPLWPSYLITEAAQRGAAAMIIYDYGQTSLDDAIRQDSVWYRDMIPVVSISGSSAKYLQEQIGKGNSEVQIENQVNASYGTSQNVLGVIRGSEINDEWVIVSAHYDRWFNSDVDNNMGVAMLLELARVLKNDHKPLRNIMFIAYGSEEAGSINTTYDWLAGSYAFVKDHPEIMGRLVQAFNFDVSGWVGQRGKVVATPDNMPFQRELVAALGLQDRLDVVHGPSATLDTWTMGAIGGGAVANISWVSSGDEAGAPYSTFYHTQLDMHGDEQFGNLKHDLEISTLGVMRASANLEVAISLTEVADWVEKGLKTDQSKLTSAGINISEFDLAIKASQDFKEQLIVLEKDLDTVASKDARMQINRRLMKTRHELMPWLHGNGGFTSRVRTYTQTQNLVAINKAIAAAKSGDTKLAATNLTHIDSMQWGKFLSNDSYQAERILLLEPSGWRTEFDQSPTLVSPAIHQLFKQLESGESSTALTSDLEDIKAQIEAYLQENLFIISGKLKAATHDLTN